MLNLLLVLLGAVVASGGDDDDDGGGGGGGDCCGDVIPSSGVCCFIIRAHFCITAYIVRTKLYFCRFYIRPNIFLFSNKKRTQAMPSSQILLLVDLES